MFHFDACSDIAEIQPVQLGVPGRTEESNSAQCGRRVSRRCAEHYGAQARHWRCFKWIQ